MRFLRANLTRIAFIVFALIFINWSQFILTTVLLEYGGSWTAFFATGVDGRFLTSQLLNLLFGLLFGSIFAFFIVRIEQNQRIPLIPNELVTPILDPLHTLKQEVVSKCNVIHVLADHLEQANNGILSNIQLLQQKDLGKLGSAHEKLVRSTERISRRIEQYLQALQLTLQIENNTFAIQRQPIHPARLLRQISAEFLPYTKIMGMKLHVSVRQPNLVIDLDKKKLRYALQSLIQNAIQYSPEGSAIHVSFEVSDGRALFLIKDTGIGIPVSEQKHLFEKYYRGTHADEFAPDGAGLGLYLAKKIALAHGGDVELISRPGKGTEVLISLPLAKQTA